MGYELADNGRLVFVAQTYFPAIDGTAVLIKHLAEQFAADGDEVHVITSDALGPTGFRTRSAERVNAARGRGHWGRPRASASHALVAERLEPPRPGRRTAPSPSRR